ncbi:MAG: hypothetical protein H6626_00965 [Pseudobdellovibrionaceae bacterium]|nr:hypothetical protein [Bdellovibrionales bacterium]USN47695.1 MAG: hypothetical protein H6626_00965 [Pseudobdellovibrionaceae bacterium]
MRQASNQKLKLMDAESNADILKDKKNTYLLLFVRPNVTSCEVAMQKFAEAPFPAHFKKLVVHLQDHCELCSRFGIQDTPSLAAVNNGTLLALVEDCEPESCEWLLEFSKQQLAHINNQ